MSLKERLARAAAYARHEAHHVQAVAYILGAAAYQVIAGAGGYDAVKHWKARDWAGHLIVTLGPAILFQLRGRHATPDEIVAAVRRGDAP